MNVSEPVNSMLRSARPLAMAVVAGAGLLVASTGGAQAQSSLAQCRAVADATARLACYDALAEPAAAVPLQVPAPGRELAPTPGRASAGSGAGAGAGVGPGAGQRAAAAPSAAPTATANAGSSDFGLERSAPRSEDLRSSLPGPFTGWGPRSRLRLANGQLWEIADGSRVVYTLSDPGVRIVRGMLGAFYLEVDGVNQRPRVRRIE